MQQVAIEKGDGYTIISHGNGAAYAIIREKDAAEVFVQGDDATTFREEYDAAVEAFSNHWAWTQQLDAICDGYFLD